MAIAVGPSVALPPRGRGGDPRKVAMSLRHHPVDPTADGDALRIAGPDALLAMALRLTQWAPSWPGMARPARRHWDLMAASDVLRGMGDRLATRGGHRAP